MQKSHPFGLAENRFTWVKIYSNGNDLLRHKKLFKSKKDNLEGGIGHYFQKIKFENEKKMKNKNKNGYQTQRDLVNYKFNDLDRKNIGLKEIEDIKYKIYGNTMGMNLNEIHLKYEIKNKDNIIRITTFIIIIDIKKLIKV